MGMPDSLNAINDGGECMSFDTGAIREPASGKGRFDLISPFAMERLARWYELGAGKYEPRNWEKGIPFSRCLDSALRHINKYQRGMKDEDHLTAAVWNLIALIHFEETKQDKELNDLPSYSDSMAFTKELQRLFKEEKHD